MQRKFSIGYLALCVSLAPMFVSCLHVTFEEDPLDTDSEDGEGNEVCDEKEGVGDTNNCTETDTKSDWSTDSETDDNTFAGIDLLVVIDNSGSMAEEQQILSTSIFNLINTLVNPVESSLSPKVEEVRVAVVSSNMGLQYGPNGSIDGFPYGDPLAVPTCSDIAARGDDGAFQTPVIGSVHIESGEIKCESNGNQCPSGWSCVHGACNSPSGNAELVNCRPLTFGNNWTETSALNPNSDLALHVACMAALGTDGCGVEQQLEASVRALSRDNIQNTFMKDDHLLAILVVSDEEDCSIADKGLFDTKEWLSGTRYDPNDPSTGSLNTACNLPVSNDNYLFETNRYYTELSALKGNRGNGVVFAAIVGVPTAADTGGDSPCEGRGNGLGNCLEHPSMELQAIIETNENGVPYKHFRPACERWADGANPSTDAPLTNARPGRRFVDVAQSFGGNGYVYSICNEDWSNAMQDVAEMISERIETNL